jgi:hypothetical protein
MPGVIFNHLDPEPADNRGCRPPGATVWANIADVGDVFAIAPGGITRFFEGAHSDTETVITKLAFHGAQHYLTCIETARTIVPYLFRA